MRIVTVFLGTWLAAASSITASASEICGEYRDFQPDEARALMSAMVTPDGDPLEQAFAFEALMCASQPTIRMLALQTGANSQSEVVRSQILLRALLEKKVLEIELGEPRPVDKTSARKLQPVPLMHLDILFRDPQAGCLSFHQSGSQKGCHPYSIAQIFGTRMTIKVVGGRQPFNGNFDYEFGDTLSGELIMFRSIYPATIKLF